MKKAAFVSHCDLEVGDVVGCSMLMPESYIIYDILTVHSFRTGEVTFIFHLADKHGNVIGADFVREQLEYPL